MLLLYQWEIFITLEVMGMVSLLLFLLFRYAFTRQGISYIFLGLFFIFLLFEVLLAILIYNKTGEISTFTIIIGVFILYAVSFGISDFRKLDRLIKKWVGRWKGVELLTEIDRERIKRAKDPKLISRKSLLWWLSHLLVFLILQTYFWLNYGKHDEGLIYFLRDWSWYQAETPDQGPFMSDLLNSISKLWILVFVIDTIISWSYIFFLVKIKSIVVEWIGNFRYNYF